MSENNTPLSAIPQDQEETTSTSLSLKDLFWMCVNRWYWFIISLVICLSLASFYILKTQKVYSRSATLLIKDDQVNGTQGGDVGAAFSGIGFLQSNTNVRNEIASIKSPMVMLEVIRRLGNNVNYSTPGTFRSNTLYGSNLPVTVSFTDMGENQGAAMQMTLNPDHTFTLTDFLDEEDEIIPHDVVTGSIATPDTVTTPYGRIAVSTNHRFTGQPLEEPMIINISRTPMLKQAQAMANNLQIPDPDDLSSVIELNYNDVSIQRAEDILNGIIDVYNENWIKDKNRIAVSTSEFIQDRLKVIEAELGNVDSDISAYKSQHMVPDLQQASQTYFQRVALASEESTEINNRLSTAKYLRDFLSDPAHTYNVLPVNTGIEKMNIAAQIDNYNKQLLERNNLVENSSDKNPLVQSLDKQLVGLRSAVIQSIDNYIATLNAELRTAEQSKARASSQLSANPTQARYLLSVERQQKVKENLYLFLLQKREENELSQAFTAYNTRLVTPPMGDNNPISPRPMRILAIAFLMGLCIPIGIIYLLENFNTKVRGRADIDHLTVPFLGEVPLSFKPRKGMGALLKNKKEEGKERVVVVKKGSANSINEAFRVLRTNLELMTDGASDHGPVIMVTSANPGSGKTFITINLGKVLAIKDKKVAVVDLDLRRASLSKSLKSPNRGISAVLSGHAQLQDVIFHNVDNTEGLDMVPVGALPPNPSEMLYSNRLKDVIEKLSSEYDYVILDCPPVEMVADAKIINRYAEMTLFVIRAGLLERGMLRRIQTFYDTRVYKNMAIVLNGTEYTQTSRYGYGYGYGYGYIHEDK